MNVGGAHNFVARLAHQQRSHGADIPETLHNYFGFFALHTDSRDGAIAHDHAAASGGFFASTRTAKFNRLAGHNGRCRVANVHRVGVHHPGHGLFIGADASGAGTSRSGPIHSLSSAV